MKKISTLLLLFPIVALGMSSCSKDTPVDPTQTTKEINTVSQFVYDGMSALYLWADEVENKKPSTNDIDPKKYFESILNQTDTEHGWSWITDDAQQLKSNFAGEPKTFGYNYSVDFFIPKNNEKTEFYYLIGYVFPNSPAANAGLKRLDLIGKIDGQPITNNNFRKLFGDNPVTLTVFKLTQTGIVQDKDIQITPTTIKTNPILYTNIYSVGDRKIGYLFYTGFISNYNQQLFDVFSKFKQAGVNELVLDLRYNHGGDISAATYLASMIAPYDKVKEKPIFTKLTYNKNIGEDKDYLGVYNEKDIIVENKVAAKAEPNPIDANLNLNNVYIIATQDSYSASELITFCLRQFLNVTHIGKKTGGKYTASITIHPFDNNLGYPLYPKIYPKKVLSDELKNKLQNWAMQPIVAKYTDKEGNDFIATNGLIPNIELTEGFGYLNNWVSIGDTKDVFLGQAIYTITGDENYKPIEPQKPTTRSLDTRNNIIQKRIFYIKDFRKESVNLNIIRHIK